MRILMKIKNLVALILIFGQNLDFQRLNFFQKFFQLLPFIFKRFPVNFKFLNLSHLSTKSCIFYTLIKTLRDCIRKRKRTFSNVRLMDDYQWTWQKFNCLNSITSHSSLYCQTLSNIILFSLLKKVPLTFCKVSGIIVRQSVGCSWRRFLWDLQEFFNYKQQVGSARNFLKPFLLENIFYFLRLIKLINY